MQDASVIFGLDGAMGVGVLTAGGLLCGISGILFWAHLKIDPRTTLREPALVVAVGVLGSGLGLLSLEYLYRNAYGMQVGFSILLLSILITSVAAAVLGWRFSSQGGIMDQLVTLRETVEETDTRVEQERAASELARVELQKTLALRIAELETEINNREATENKLIDAKEQAEMANRAKSAFLASMSHELRTPLNAILGFSEVLASDFGINLHKEKIREYADDIRASGMLLLDLINDLLDLAKIEEGRFELKEQPLDPSEVCQDVIRMMSGAVSKKQLTLTLAAPDEPLSIYTDRRALRQVLLNLLSNAVKFTQEGEIKVKLLREAPSGDLLLQVTDTGIGIPEQDLQRVLEPFTQLTPQIRDHGSGSGLGLPLAKSLVELHQGTLSLASTLGRGTSVTVRLPKDRVRHVA